MMRKRIIICCWIICCYVSMTAQTLILEQVRIHTDRMLYASGDTMWLKLYVTDALTLQPTTLSSIVYVELWDAQGEIQFQTKALLEKGKGTATIDIPPGQKTGEYLIRAYTRWMANGAPDNFAHQPIVIFDPSQPIPVRDTSQLPEDFKQAFQPPPASNLSPEQQETLQIELSLNKTQATSREQIHLEITTKDTLGAPVFANLSLSVAKAFPVEQLMLSTYLDVDFGDTSQQSEANQLPDFYGLNLSGTVVNDLEQGVGGATVFFCLPGTIPVVQYTESTAEGWFRFLLPKLYGNREILIAAIDARGKALQVKLDTDILGGRPRLPDWSLTFPQEVVEELQQYIIQHRIQKAYQSAISVALVEQELSLNPFYQAADHVYILDEYTRFSMGETFPEIIYSVSLTNRQGKPYARVNNTQTGQVMEGAPLILIDGVPVPDISYILALESTEVERIEVVANPYYLYGQVYDGIIHAVTVKGNAEKVEIPEGAVKRPYAFLSPKRTFQSWKPEEVPNSNAERIPDMRRLLLWEPMIQTDENGKAHISFWTSDIDGIFEIQVKGLTDEGLWGNKRLTLAVVEKTQ